MKYSVSELIMGFLKNTLDREGVDEFYAWVNSDPENKKLYFEAKTIYDACTAGRAEAGLDESWNRLLEKRQLKQPAKKPLTIWRRIASYAAVACVAALVASAFVYYNRSEPQSLIAEYIGGDGLVADKIVLPDGTQICIGSRTRLHCDPGYGKKNRIVYLEGEAFFDVAPQKNNPFIVKVDGQQVEALGTKFNVMAYDADSIFTTTLLEGAVQLTSENVAQTTVLKPNQQLVYHRKKHKTKVGIVEASRYVSWTDGYYYFPDQTLYTILDRLSHIYGWTFEVKSETLGNKRFTGTFYRGQSIKDILDIIHISIPLKYEIEEQKAILY